MSSTQDDPAPQRSLNRQVVLEEEEYTDALSKIIARDFFPSLAHLDATNEYLDALKTRDPHLIHASVRRMEEITATPLTRPGRAADTPYGYAEQTPARSEFGEPAQKRRKFDLDMSLDDFQARYTSEDNSSFTQILDEENKVRKDKWSWAWEAQKRVEQQRDRMLENRERMLIEPGPSAGVLERVLIEQPKPAGLITEGKEEEVPGSKDKDEEQVKSSALVVRDGDQAVDVLAPKKDTRRAGVDGWEFKARNSLMFSPDADDSPYHPRPGKSDEQASVKLVKHSNTRLPEQEHDVSASRSVSQPPSPTRSRIDAAITGTPYHPRSPKEDFSSLVPDLPSPTPAELGERAVKQLMTWGTITSTPRIISQTDEPIDPQTPFHLPAITARENLSHRLSNKASKSLRVKAEMLTPRTSRSNMPPPSWTPRRSDAAGNLTPAGRRLLERTTLGVAAVRRADTMERNANWDAGRGRDLNRVRWTPTPSSAAKR